MLINFNRLLIALTVMLSLLFLVPIGVHANNCCPICLTVDDNPTSQDAVRSLAAGAPIDAQGLAVSTSRLWGPGQNITVKFLSGSDFVKSQVMRYAKEWERYANIRFSFIDSGSSQIRIGFSGVGYWSYVGTDCLNRTDQSEPTMNFEGFNNSTSDWVFRRVVLHEFGHALGMIHEHQSPASGIPWDRNKVYAYYQGPPNNWTRAQVDHNIFARYASTSTQFSEYDPRSIMHYSVSNSLTIGNYSVGFNSYLSPTDKAFISRIYPFDGNPDFYLPELTSSDQIGDLGGRFVDLNRDGLEDFVFYRYASPGNVRRGAYLNTGSGWTLMSENYFLPDLTSADSIEDVGSRFVDVDHDGHKDFVIHRYLNPSLRRQVAYRNTGSGWSLLPDRFAPPYHISADEFGDLGARFIDVDHDGFEDLVFFRYVGPGITQSGAYRNTGNGWETLSADFIPPELTSSDLHQDIGVRFVDVDHDGYKDLVYHRYLNPDLTVKRAYRNTGSGWSPLDEKFVPPYHIAADSYGDLGARFIDLDGDGHEDLTYSRYLGPGLSQLGAYRSTGNGWVKLSEAFHPPELTSSDLHEDIGTRFVDMNGDGLKDCVFFRYLNTNLQKRGAYFLTPSGWDIQTYQSSLAGFEAFVARESMNSSIPISANPEGDADQDNIPSLVEYALGGGLNEADLNLFSIENFNQRPAISFRRPTLYNQLGIDYIFEQSSDLEAWEPIEDPPVILPNVATGGFESVIIPIVPGADDLMHYRIKVELAE